MRIEFTGGTLYVMLSPIVIGPHWAWFDEGKTERKTGHGLHGVRVERNERGYIPIKMANGKGISKDGTPMGR